MTPLDRAHKLSEKVLKYAAHAHKFFVGLKDLDISADMSKYMMAAANGLQALYSKLSKLIVAKANTDDDYKQITEEASEIMDKIDEYTPLAQNMLSRRKAKRPKPDVTEPKPKKKPRVAPTGK